MLDEWLEARLPGYSGLPGPDRGAILDFTFLWSLFEARIMNSSGSAVAIRNKVFEWEANKSLCSGLYDEDLVYFQDRYSEGGELSGHFEFLKLRPSDYPDVVKTVILGTNRNRRDRQLALLMIVWRLRNNLFHGEKWEYEIRDQLENFTHANNVLKHLLEQHGHLG